jgi:UDPglucose--hexose-1-phosphate uridylyltransferase
MSNTGTVWEQRWHPLREEWVLFTSHRGGRPWLGETHRHKEQAIPAYDATCALCPGNKRLKGQNPPYTSTFVFTNDLPCFSAESPNVPAAAPDDMYARRPARGTAEVICYSPDHGKTFALLTEKGALEVTQLWRDRYVALAADPNIDHVLIFENKGSQVGTSNPHPHCQVYAGNMIYGLTERHVESGRKHFARTGRLLGQDIVAREAASPRVIAQNESFLACVPWFARYAYEVFVLPRKTCTSLRDLDDDQLARFASILREVTIRYDNLWRQPMPYVMAIHQAPTDGGDYSTFPFHVEFHPPLRNPDTMKFLAGPEIGGGSMTNESNPDEKAAELRAVSAVHYTLSK